MRFLAFIILIYLFGVMEPRAEEQAQVCKITNPTESFKSLWSLSHSLPPILGLTQVNNIPEFCRVNGMRDVFDSVTEHANGQSPWIDNFIAAKDHRDEQFGSKSDLKYLINQIQSAHALTSEEADRCKSEITSLKKRHGTSWFKSNVDQVGILYFCKDLTLIHIVSCSKALLDMQRYLKPVQAGGALTNGPEITGLDIWEEVLTDPVYDRVLRKVSLNVLQNVQQNLVPKKRLFDELNEAFSEDLKDPQKAMDYTWNTLGALATGGANVSMRVTRLCDETPPSVIHSLEAIAIGSLTLDRNTAQQGFLYTYPKEIDSLCDYGKNYHFWMTAFLARRAMKQTGDVTAAAAAAFTVDKGYQFIKNGGGRDRTRAFKTNMFSNYNNNMRLDLTQAAAGAWFGATSIGGGSKQLTREHFEKGMKQVFEGAKPIELDPQFKFPSDTDVVNLRSTYVKWKAVVNPDAAFKYYEQFMNP